MRVASPGHAFFAVTLIGLGILGLVKGDFTPTWTGVPGRLPAREAVAYLCAIVSLATGIGLLLPRTAASAARILLGCFLVWLLLFRVSHIFSAPTVEATYWACGDTAVMAAGTWALYAWLVGDRDRPPLRLAAGTSGLRIARSLYGLALIPFGVAHFTYLRETAVLVPGWLPWHTAWAYATGGAFIAAGMAVLIGVLTRLAIVLSALQLGLFTLLVWVPIVVAGPSASQWAEFVDSWALTAGAWLVADSCRSLPWLSAGRHPT